MHDEHITRPLDSGRRARLLALVQGDEKGTTRKLGISRMALMRALSGLPVYGSTRVAVELGMALIEGPAAIADMVAMRTSEASSGY